MVVGSRIWQKLITQYVHAPLEGLDNIFFVEKVKIALKNHKVFLKDLGRPWTLWGSALVSLDSLDMIF